MTNALLCPRITETQCQLARKTMPLIKGPQRQKTGVRTDLAPPKNQLEWVGVGSRKTTAVIYKRSSLGAPKENAGFC
jgi:hypothetical protein